MTDEPRNKFATFAYGRRYLTRPDRIPVDPVALPLHDPGTEVTFRTEGGFAVFSGIRDAAPDGWGQYLMYKGMARPSAERGRSDPCLGRLQSGGTCIRPRA